MIDWRMALVALGIAWVLQGLCGWLHLRRCRAVLGELAASRPDGWLATGSARGRLGRRAVAVLVAAPDGTVDRAMAMTGWSSTAAFQPIPDLAGRGLTGLAAESAAGLVQRAVVDAARRACRLREENKTAGRGASAPSEASSWTSSAPGGRPPQDR
ncbi:transcriptional regulator GutM [Methylobacterium sp. ID0610]|uniref:transcriptional regulator GutM n=1 Tax=Methylobacterium carpenticola TaxID=3344827 RepID=UPI0036C0ECA9